MPEDCYEVDGAPEKHDRNVWECKEGPPPYYVLKASKRAEDGGQPKKYNCSEYTVAKLEGRPPHWPPQNDPGTHTTETAEIEAKLKVPPFSFVELTSPDGSQAPADCACARRTKCVVMYFDRGAGTAGTPREPYHVAIFDPRYCDWGGKESGFGEIRRYKNPGDYLELRKRHYESQGLTPPDDYMVFLCPSEQDEAWKPKTDFWLHEQASEARPPATEPQGRGGCAGVLVFFVALGALAISLA